MRNHSVWTVTGVETENIKYATAIYSESVNKTTQQMIFRPMGSPGACPTPGERCPAWEHDTGPPAREFTRILREIDLQTNVHLEFPINKILEGSMTLQAKPDACTVLSAEDSWIM